MREPMRGRWVHVICSILECILQDHHGPVSTMQGLQHLRHPAQAVTAQHNQRGSHFVDQPGLGLLSPTAASRLSCAQNSCSQLQPVGTCV